LSGFDRSIGEMTSAGFSRTTGPLETACPGVMPSAVKGDRIRHIIRDNGMTWNDFIILPFSAAAGVRVSYIIL
jgi:hypothetical protein